MNPHHRSPNSPFALDHFDRSTNADRDTPSKQRRQPFAVFVVSSLLVLSSWSVLAQDRMEPVGTNEYRYELIQHHVQRRSDDTFIAATFSGGGMRAAALAYGALTALRDTRINPTPEDPPLDDSSLQESSPSPLLSDVDFVSSVSGGSVTAAFWALHGASKEFDRFDEVFLKQPVQNGLIAEMFNPPNIIRMIVSRKFSRTDVLSDYFSEALLGDFTYRDLLDRTLKHQDRPYLVINATDVGIRTLFPFVQLQFDLICADLGTVKLADAVAASSAYPLAFAALSIENRRVNDPECGTVTHLREVTEIVENNILRERELQRILSEATTKVTGMEKRVSSANSRILEHEKKLTRAESKVRELRTDLEAAGEDESGLSEERVRSAIQAKTAQWKFEIETERETSITNALDRASKSRHDQLREIDRRLAHLEEKRAQLDGRLLSIEQENSSKEKTFFAKTFDFFLNLPGVRSLIDGQGSDPEATRPTALDHSLEEKPSESPRAKSRIAVRSVGGPTDPAEDSDGQPASASSPVDFSSAVRVFSNWSDKQTLRAFSRRSSDSREGGVRELKEKTDGGHRDPSTRLDELRSRAGELARSANELWNQVDASHRFFDSLKSDPEIIDDDRKRLNRASRFVARMGLEAEAFRDALEKIEGDLKKIVNAAASPEKASVGRVPTEEMGQKNDDELHVDTADDAVETPSTAASGVETSAETTEPIETSGNEWGLRTIEDVLQEATQYQEELEALHGHVGGFQDVLEHYRDSRKRKHNATQLNQEIQDLIVAIADAEKERTGLEKETGESISELEGKLEEVQEGIKEAYAEKTRTEEEVERLAGDGTQLDGIIRALTEQHEHAVKQEELSRFALKLAKKEAKGLLEKLEEARLNAQRKSAERARFRTVQLEHSAAAENFARQRRYYEDEENRFVHLMDGGAADNLGFSPLVELLDSFVPADAFSADGKARGTADGWQSETKHVAVVLVDARNRPRKNVANDSSPPGLIDTVLGTVSTAIDGKSFMLTKELERVTRKLEADGVIDKRFVVRVDFDSIESEKGGPDLSSCRNAYGTIPTNWKLDPEVTDALMAMGRGLVLNSSHYEELVVDVLKGELPARESLSAVCEEYEKKLVAKQVVVPDEKPSWNTTPDADR